jgi:hypothetical protein
MLNQHLIELRKQHPGVSSRVQMGRRQQPGVPRCRSEVVVHHGVAVPPALPAPVAAAGNSFEFNNSQGQRIRNAILARRNQEQVQRNTAALLTLL